MDKIIKAEYSLYTAEEIAASPDKEKVKLIAYVADVAKPSVIVIPGGGYFMVAVRDEGVRISQALNVLGYNAFVLDYRVNEVGIMPKPMDDLARAVEVICSKGEELFGLRSKQYAVAGFSSGGHMAALWASKRHGWRNYRLGRPGAIFLAYPLISISMKKIMADYGLGTTRDLFHANRTVQLVCGEQFDDEKLVSYDAEKLIDGQCPPMYIVHGELDTAVYLRNSEILVESLKKHEVPYVARYFKGLEHAFSAGEGTEAEGWLSDAVKFWESTTLI